MVVWAVELRSKSGIADATRLLASRVEAAHIIFLKGEEFEYNKV
jgi:hypothetical protein